MRSVVFAATLLLATPSFAVGLGNDNEGSGGGTQEQAQVQNQGQGQSQNVNVAPALSTEAYVGEVYSGVSVEAYKPAVSSAPDLYVASCNRGVSGQMFDAGGSLGSKDPVCTYLDLAFAAQRLGNEAAARTFFERAVSEANTRHYLTRVFSWIPVIGFLF